MANKKVVVAFSGGLDTSYTVMKLTQDGWDVYAACANTGGFSAEQLKTNEENAYKLGAKAYVTLDVTHEYYEKSLKYMIFGNVLRNNCYPISVSSERIFQAIAIARYAKEIGADAIAHGSTGAGNDQIRFDMTFLVMAPGVEIITLTRDKALSRKEEVDYLNEHGFYADFTKLKYSYNVGIWGTSICGGEILDPTQGLPEEAYLKHVTAKEEEAELKITFEKGEIVAVNGEKFDDKIAAIQKIEEIGASYAIGRDCNVGDTIIGIKGRVAFEALTSGSAVMKMNTQLGYLPVTFADLTDDESFWRGCEGCINVDVLHRTNRKYCICTAMLFDPEEHLPIKLPQEVIERIRKIDGPSAEI